MPAVFLNPYASRSQHISSPKIAQLRLNDIQAKIAKEKGCKLSIGTDTHILEQMEFMHLGVSVARRAWLTPQDLLNTLTYSELTSYLGKDKRH